ncbi:DsbA family oxidoreductase [Micromonospora sp. NPDC005174]|uniref:DsbA family oxidoreductase n=1 Tax=Micromonospora sp. NPDC005174 TaxID=3157018 RepID=UPI0033A671C3
MPADADRSTRVEFVLDLICVHSYLAFTRFEKAAARRRADGRTIEVTFRPFQIDAGAPEEGEPLTERHRRDFGAAAEEMVQRMTGTAARDGLSLDFGRAVFVNTFRAHLLLATAQRQGRAEAAAERLFRAYFSEGRNIGDPDTLDELAADAGVTPVTAGGSGPGPDEVAAALLAVRERGVTSVPLVRVDDGPELSGARSEDEYLDALSPTR